MDHISGNEKSLTWSSEVLIDRAYPDPQHVQFPDIAIHFYGPWLP